MTTTKLFDPIRQPYRDGYGFTAHPDLDLFTTEAGAFDEDALARVGIALAVRELADDAPLLLEAYQEHDEHAVAAWDPTPPEGEGWRLVAVYDTENDPIAVFIRPLD